MYLGVGGLEDIADHVRRFRAMGVLAVSERLLEVALPQGIEDLRMAALQVIAFEKDHGMSSNQKTVCKIHKKSENEKSRDSHRSFFSILTKILNQ